MSFGSRMEVLKFLESIRNPALTMFFRFWTLFGEETVCIVIICIFYWCINKKFACKMIYTLLFSGLLVQTLKITFRVERPWIKDPDFHAVEAVLPKATGYSFPSGHTQTAAAVFMPLALYFKKYGLKILCVFIFLMVGLSRMYLGVHTPVDVIVSIALTVGIAFIVDYIQKFGWIIILAAFVVSIFIGEPDLIKIAALGIGAVGGLYLEKKWINFEVKFNPLKIIIGLAVLYVLKSFIHSDNLLVITAQYLSMALWITALYPLLVKTLRPLHRRN